MIPVSVYSTVMRLLDAVGNTGLLIETRHGSFVVTPNAETRDRLGMKLAADLHTCGTAEEALGYVAGWSDRLEYERRASAK